MGKSASPGRWIAPIQGFVSVFVSLGLFGCFLSAGPVLANPGDAPGAGLKQRAEAAMSRLQAAGASGRRATPPASGQGLATAAARTPVTKLSGRLRSGLAIRTTRTALRSRGSSGADSDASAPALTPYTDLRTRNDGRAQVYVRAANLGGTLLAELAAAGLDIEITNPSLGVVQGWIDPADLDVLAGIDEVIDIDIPAYATQRAGSRLTEGDSILRSDLLRALNVSGRGVRVGIISDGANDWTDARDTGDLPLSGITLYGSCTREPGDAANCIPAADCNEGTAMAEIIHDIAPEAEIAVGAAGTSLEFIDRINDLANDFGADIIVDDLGFRNEPFLEDGPVAQAVQAATANLLYVSAAGNSAVRHHEAGFIDHNVASSIDDHDFGTASGAVEPDSVFPIYTEPGGLAVTFLQWSDPFGASANNYDLYLELRDPDTFDLITSFASLEVQDGDDDPLEVTGFCNTSNAPVFGFFYVNKASGDDRFLEVEGVTNQDSVVVAYTLAEGSIFGHPSAPGAVAVGAIRADDPDHDTIEFFSSQGPARIFHPVVETRDKPDVTAIDGVSVTGAGGFVETFFGTSAAAPHVAGIAALLREAMPHATPAELRTALLDGAVELGAPGRDMVFGEGRVDALLSEALVDTDDDGQLNGVDDDDDGDDVTDADEALAGTFRIDPDSDDDDVLDNADLYPLNSFLCLDSDTDLCDDCASGVFDAGNDGRDTNMDGICDAGDPDNDGDGVDDVADNCPWVVNASQDDMDNNGVGDDCQQCALIRQRGNRFQHLCF